MKRYEFVLNLKLEVQHGVISSVRAIPVLNNYHSFFHIHFNKDCASVITGTYLRHFIMDSEALDSIEAIMNGDHLYTVTFRCQYRNGFVISVVEDSIRVLLKF